MELVEASSVDNPTTPEPRDYVNPLESSSRWYLNARAQLIRYAASVGFSIANRAEPPVPEFTREIYLDSTLSLLSGPKKIKTEVWIPPRVSIGPRPAVITFHGGGWILGQGTDNARWAGAVMSQLDAVVFTVNYRLAPSFPFPTPIEDCVDAVCQIVRHAGEFGIDPDKIIISGFSAGATNTLAAWICLQEPEKFGYTLPFHPPRIAGLVLFYPTLDYTMSRPDKREQCPRPDLTLPKSLTDLIDASYVYPPIMREKRSDPRLSPGLMSDELVKKLPPIHLCLCEYDMLLLEGMKFASRLKDNRKQCEVRVVKGEKHAWDGPPPMAPKESVGIEYGAAVQSMADWLGGDTTDKDSVRTVRTKKSRLDRPTGLLIRAVSALEVRSTEKKLQRERSSQLRP
ncbi:unnamed protein product [Clonostachys rosea]|uniref:Alpha/beta hydrolase fold-3 domain-containing protein n=1 Tax=Bionectria ochroleuca TaxID=29856 RepID=A0ABY6TTM4_BIOOC|nr:unnamed protein product [Clonostachys rosea]